MQTSPKTLMMNESIAHPSQQPEQAALQVVIELVRAGKLSPLQGDAGNMISLYEQFKSHFSRQSSGQ